MTVWDQQVRAKPWVKSNKQGRGMSFSERGFSIKTNFVVVVVVV